jgi:hypothetical protein
VKRLTVGALVVLLLTPAALSAKTLYVDRANGNDSTSYANNSASTPWATIGRAAWGSTSRTAPNANEAARAGDTVIVRAGTYSAVAAGQRYEPTFNPANSGSPGSPIVFQAEGLVQLTHSSSSGPAIGAYTKNYIIWRGFTIDEAAARTQGDSGPAVLWYTTGSAIENCVIIGVGNPGWEDNHTGIRIVEARNVAVRNNRVSNILTAASNESNGSAIQVYFSGEVVIENNELLDSGSGIFLKAPYGPNLGTFTIRYNLVRGMSEEGIALHRSPNPANAPIYVYQNIVMNNGTGIRIWPFEDGNGSTEPMNAKIVNNTIYNSGPEGLSVSGNLMPNAGHRFWNNIVYGGNRAINYAGSAAPNQETRIDFEHNLYWGFSTFAIAWTSNHTLASWKSSFGQDNAAPASINVNPLLVAPGTDFRLQAASPARTLGVDLLDLNHNGSTTDIIPAGAYVTGTEVIGRTSGGGMPPPTPSAPTSLRILR